MNYKRCTDTRCETCGRFYRHYIRVKENDYCATAYGHCPYPRMKLRRLEDSCENWTPIVGNSDKEKAPDI